MHSLCRKVDYTNVTGWFGQRERERENAFRGCTLETALPIGHVPSCNAPVLLAVKFFVFSFVLILHVSLVVLKMR